MCFSLLLDDSRNWDRVVVGDLRAGGTWEDLGYEQTSSKAGIQDTSHNGNGRNLKVLYLFVNRLPRRLLGHTS